MVTTGEDKSLTWNYTLTADEQAKSQSLYTIKWKKCTSSSSDYVLIGSKTFLSSIGVPLYQEPSAPHINIDKNDPATLLINNVRREDEGTYKIEYSVVADGAVLADHEVNVTVLGKLSHVRFFSRFKPISKFGGLNSGSALVRKQSHEKSYFY